MVTRSRSSSFLDREDCVDGLSEHRRLGRISRSADGRFVLTRDSRSSSLSSSSDDGGFLSHPSFSNRTWSQRHLIIGGDDDDDSPVDSRRRPIVVATVCSQTPAFTNRASSPTSRHAMVQPADCFGQDLSSVPGSAERTLRSVHEQYSQQLPSLRVIHEENQRTLLNRCARAVQQPSPARYHQNTNRFRSRHMRYARSAPELTSDVHQMTATTAERSPESRSSSSGFGSKNTSSLLQHHPQQPTGNDWTSAAPRTTQLPPYKPPPPVAAPPPVVTSSLFYANEHWMDLTSPVLPSPSSHSSATSNKPLSVDDQYEFDPVFPVSPTPTDHNVMMANGYMMMMTTSGRTPTTPSPSRSRTPTQLKKAKYENVEARLQAMKEEFYAYKRRQAEMARMAYVESAC